MIFGFSTNVCTRRTYVIVFQEALRKIMSCMRDMAKGPYTKYVGGKEVGGGGGVGRGFLWGS